MYTWFVRIIHYHWKQADVSSVLLYLFFHWYCIIFQFIQIIVSQHVKRSGLRSWLWWRHLSISLSLFDPSAHTMRGYWAAWGSMPCRYERSIQLLEGLVYFPMFIWLFIYNIVAGFSVSSRSCWRRMCRWAWEGLWVRPMCSLWARSAIQVWRRMSVLQSMKNTSNNLKLRLGMRFMNCFGNTLNSSGRWVLLSVWLVMILVPLIQPYSRTTG